MCLVVLTLSHSGLKLRYWRKSPNSAAFHQVSSVARSLHCRRVVSDGQLEEILIRLCLINHVGAAAGVAAEAARLVPCLRGRLRLAALLRAAPSA